MEIGAVMGAAPRRAVKRENSDPGDIIILLGGRTGRDGIGGATGSSKVHTEASIEVRGAEVQKGNPPTARQIQRLFRPFFQLVCRHFLDFKRICHIIKYIHMRPNGVRLKNHADMAFFRRHEDPGVRFADYLVADGDFAFGRPFKAGNHPQHCRLATAGWS